MSHVSGKVGPLRPPGESRGISALCYADHMRFNKVFRAVAGLLILFVIFAARAQDTGCKDAATTAAMRACENSRYESAEQALDEEYGRLMRQMSPSRQRRLSEAQRSWVAFRAANADFLASAAEGGSLAPLLKVTALADMTEARVTELRKLAKH